MSEVMRTSGFATLNTLHGFKSMGVIARVGHSKKKKFDPAQIIDDPDATDKGIYEYDFLPKSMQTLSPDYLTHKMTYWLAPIEFLRSIVKELNVRFPDNHRSKAGLKIKPEDVDPGNMNDSFFLQLIDQQQFIRRAVGGTYLMDLSDPLDRFYFYYYLYHPFTKVKGGRQISKYLMGKAEFELVMPETEKKQKIAEADLDIEAITLLSKGDSGIGFEKQKRIAQIMKVPNVDFNDPDTENLRLSLKISAAQNTKKLKKYGCTVQERFIKLAKMPNEELDIIARIYRCFDLNIIIKRNNTYEFENEIISRDIVTEDGLINYLRATSHWEIYEKILAKLDEVEAQMYGSAK